MIWVLIRSLAIARSLFPRSTAIIIGHHHQSVEGTSRVRLLARLEALGEEGSGVAATGAVVGQGVDGVVGDARDHAVEAGLGDVGAELLGLGGGIATQTQEVGSQTSDVGAGHGSAGDDLL